MITEERIKSYQKMMRENHGREASREEAIEELGRLVQLTDLLIDVWMREKAKEKK
jgi:hypothetical protein